MKKFIFSALAAIGLLLSPSCSDENEVLSGSDNEALVSFNVNLADGISTKAIGGGNEAKYLRVRVYENATESSHGTLISALNVNKEMSGLSTSVDLTLVKGKEYNILFWADGFSSTSPYSIGNDGVVSVSYEGAISSDEKRDAFFATQTLTLTENTENHNVKLKRPFAQLNFLVPASEITTAKSMGLDFSDAITQVKVTGAAITFDPFNQTATGSVDATFDNGAIPFAAKLDANMLSEVDKLTTIDGNTEYYYLATNYILVRTALTDITMTLKDKGDTHTVDVPNAPVAMNYRTNIFGNMLTEQGTINVELSADYENGDLAPDDQP